METTNNTANNMETEDKEGMTINLGRARLILWYKGLPFGDEHDYSDAEEFARALVNEVVAPEVVFKYMVAAGLTDSDCNEWHDLELSDCLDLLEECDELVISPVSKYEHGGMCLYLGSRCGWDWGPCGWIYQLKSETPAADSEDWHEIATTNMEAKIDEYNGYLNE